MPPFKKRIGPQTVIYTTIRGKSMVKEMEDVLGTPEDGYVLIWNDALKKFEFGPMSGGGGGGSAHIIQEEGVKYEANANNKTGTMAAGSPSYFIS
jgi:hypothetical protein